MPNQNSATMSDRPFVRPLVRSVRSQFSNGAPRRSLQNESSSGSQEKFPAGHPLSYENSRTRTHRPRTVWVKPGEEAQMRDATTGKLISTPVNARDLPEIPGMRPTIRATRRPNRVHVSTTRPTNNVLARRELDEDPPSVSTTFVDLSIKDKNYSEARRQVAHLQGQSSTAGAQSSEMKRERQNDQTQCEHLAPPKPTVLERLESSFEKECRLREEKFIAEQEQTLREYAMKGAQQAQDFSFAFSEPMQPRAVPEPIPQTKPDIDQAKATTNAPLDRADDEDEHESTQPDEQKTISPIVLPVPKVLAEETPASDETAEPIPETTNDSEIIPPHMRNCTKPRPRRVVNRKPKEDVLTALRAIDQKVQSEDLEPLLEEPLCQREPSQEGADRGNHNKQKRLMALRREGRPFKDDAAPKRAPVQDMVKEILKAPRAPREPENDTIQAEKAQDKEKLERAERYRKALEIASKQHKVPKLANSPPQRPRSPPQRVRQKPPAHPFSHVHFSKITIQTSQRR